jgi:DNA repair protein RadD
MSKTLRPYQKKIVDDTLLELKTSNDPILIEASVGAGKSLILASVLLVLERAGFDALCLTLNSTLIQQNAEAYKLQQGDCSIYCAGLKSKCCENVVVFASPNSICQGIKNKEKIHAKPFRLIVIDEVHNLNFHDSSSMYMRILNHYSMLAQLEGYSFKVIGLTGTPYRGKGISIVGKNEFFKSKICSVTAAELISQGYLVRPQFGLIDTDAYDFSKLRVNNTGKFNTKELQAVLDQNERLTAQIMRELVVVMENRRGCFIFASTRKHCEECFNALPAGQAKIITGETPHEERKQILDDARRGNIRYLISVMCLNVGVDVPSFDVCAWLRPTESLVLYTQGIGRILRLHPDKRSGLVLDYAGNLDRHGDLDDPIINEALKPNAETEKDYVIPCYTCGTLNTVHSRRCIGRVADARCSHYFEFKACPQCGAENDITSRACRGCDFELIDPNAKLSIKAVDTYEIGVTSAEYWTSVMLKNTIVNAKYNTQSGSVFESYSTNSGKSRNILYAKFVKLHTENPSKHYMHLNSPVLLRLMLVDAKTPHTLICTKDKYGHYVIKSKLFD